MPFPELGSWTVWTEEMELDEQLSLCVTSVSRLWRRCGQLHLVPTALKSPLVDWNLDHQSQASLSISIWVFLVK